MATQPTPIPPAPIQPNLYVLAGAGLSVTYATSGIDGKPHFTYHHVGSPPLTFAGDQIETSASPLGTLVTVVIFRTIDTGSTTFTLLVPRVNLNAGEQIQIATDGITTIHRFFVNPRLLHGQLDLYTVTPLRGTASHVVF